MLFSNVKDICAIHQKDGLTCPHNSVFFSSSVIWCVLSFSFYLRLLTLVWLPRGLIGPTRQFGVGSQYHPQVFAVIIGAFLPIPFWLWQRRYPTSWVKRINIPVILNGVSGIPPAVGINYSAWFAVGFVWQYLIRKGSFAWWSKFNYITSAALDSGTVLSLIFIFLTLEVSALHCFGSQTDYILNGLSAAP